MIRKVMDVESKKLNEMHNSNVSLNKQMSEASKPMDTLGKEMGQLGKQMGQLSKQADNEVRELIQAAKQKGLVTPLEKI
jgi:CII-binding regulator of phage lambda lysogenization HflD